MTNLERDTVEAIITKLQAAVADSANWTFYREEPINHPARGQNCAVWYDGAAAADENDTTGWFEMAETYGVRYWEAAPEQTHQVVNEDAAKTMEGLMDGVVNTMALNHGSLETTGTGVYETQVRGYEKFLGRDGDNPIRGFEVALRCRRPRKFT